VAAAAQVAPQSLHTAAAAEFHFQPEAPPPPQPNQPASPSTNFAPEVFEEMTTR
jgi:hypothetical protein